MSIISEHEKNLLYKTYNDIDLKFTKEVINTLGIDTRQIFLKLHGKQFPCIIHSCSMVGAKVITNIPEEFTNEIKQNSNISLRFYFKTEENVNPITFFISSKTINLMPYDKNFIFISLKFNQLPPSDLIINFGKLIEARKYYTERKETRINIDPISLRRLEIKSKVCNVKIGKSKINCVLSDLSFSGAKIIVNNEQVPSEEQNIELFISLEDKFTPIHLKGAIIRKELSNIDSKIIMISILFDEETIPLEYKMIISNYLKNQNKYLIKN